jgi:hypothetical protein
LDHAIEGLRLIVSLRWLVTPIDLAAHAFSLPAQEKRTSLISHVSYCSMARAMATAAFRNQPGWNPWRGYG